MAGNDLTITKDYDRSRRDPEFEKDLELSANYVHSFIKEDHELTVDYTTSHSMSRKITITLTPIVSLTTLPTYDNTLIKQGENESQFSVEYVNPVSEDIKIEAGYILESRKSDMDFFGESFNPDTGSG